MYDIYLYTQRENSRLQTGRRCYPEECLVSRRCSCSLSSSGNHSGDLSIIRSLVDIYPQIDQSEGCSLKRLHFCSWAVLDLLLFGPPSVSVKEIDLFGYWKLNHTMLLLSTLLLLPILSRGQRTCVLPGGTSVISTSTSAASFVGAGCSVVVGNVDVTCTGEGDLFSFMCK